MMTREEILSIEEYCSEHKISHKKRLEELGILFWNFYKAKQKYYYQLLAATTGYYRVLAANCFLNVFELVLYVYSDAIYLLLSYTADSGIRGAKHITRMILFISL